MQIERINGTVEEKDGLSLAELLEESRKAFEDPEVVKVTSYPRYVVQHEGPNRRQRRAMARGKLRDDT